MLICFVGKQWNIFHSTIIILIGPTILCYRAKHVNGVLAIERYCNIKKNVGYLPIMPANARDNAGTSRDKQGQSRDTQGKGRDKQGQTGTFPFCPSLSLLVPVCPCLSMSVPVCPCLSLSVLVCPCLSLLVHVCSCLSLYVSTIAIPSCLPLQINIYRLYQLH